MANEVKIEKAIFAAGCFWHVQHEFDMINGVVKTTAGYIGGNEKLYPHPTYEMLAGDKTGYVEAVEVEFNPEIIPYKWLLEKFWRMHDPLLHNRQGPDIGKRYQAEIFYLNDTQKKIAEKSKKVVIKAFPRQKVYTLIEKAETFFPAEEYHQKYIEKHGKDSCPVRF